MSVLGLLSYGGAAIGLSFALFCLGINRDVVICSNF